MDFETVLMENIGTIFSAMVSAIALLKVSSIEYKQKGQRSHWFFDEYLYSVGKCIENYQDHKEEYYANYMRYLLYADKILEMYMEKVDIAIKSRDRDEIIKNVKIIKEIYREKYAVEQYDLKTKSIKNKMWDMLQKLKIVWRKIR